MPICIITSLPHDTNAIRNYDYWKWMVEGTPSDWAETYTPEIVIGTRPQSPTAKTTGWNNNIYITLYRTQHVYKQIQDVLLTFYHLEEAAYQIEQAFRWMKTWNWNNLNNAVRASRFSHEYSNRIMNKICSLNTKVKSQQRVYGITQAAI